MLQQHVFTETYGKPIQLLMS